MVLALPVYGYSSWDHSYYIFIGPLCSSVCWQALHICDSWAKPPGVASVKMSILQLCIWDCLSLQNGSFMGVVKSLISVTFCSRMCVTKNF